MPQQQRERQSGMWTIACVLGAFATVSVSLVREVYADFFIALIVLVAAYAGLYDLPVLWRTKKTRREGSNTSDARTPVHRRTPGETVPRTISLLRE